MKKQIMILTALALLLSGTNLLCAPMDGRILVLNFECSGVANGYSDAIGDSLRSHIVKLGGQVVSHNLFEQLIRSRGKTESDLNFMPDEIKSILPQLNGQGAVYGQVYMSHGMLTMDMKYIEGNLPAPIIINPFVVGNLKDLYNVIPEAAYIILSPDKESPSVISVSPPDNSDKLDEYLDMKISFSEPMNPETFSLKAKPAEMWSRYGDVIYDDKTNTFTFKLHLYGNIDYEFMVNGGENRGFKDISGNPAQKYVWKISTRQ